jgi:hypothetical protein
MKKMNVLVFPCGSENAGEIAQSLRYSLHINRLIGASSCDDHGRFHFADYIGDVPFISAPEFDSHFREMLVTHKIDVIFATHDTVCEKLAEMDDLAGCYLVNGDRETTRIARRKVSHISALRAQAGSRMFTLWKRQKAGRSLSNLTVVRGNGIALAANEEQLAQSIAGSDMPVIVEYLPGRELTVDCFTNRRGELVWAGPRTRERVRAGITMRSQSVALDDEIAAIAREINAGLTLRGPWFFQLKQDSAQRWKLLEVSCRVAGTMVAQRARGVNLPLMALHDFMGRDVIPLVTPHVTLIERSIRTRAATTLHYQRVYVDLDDTLIIRQQPNPVVLAFLYQSRARGKSLHLITRHEKKPLETLNQAAISPLLFDEIIHLQDSVKKSTHIKGPAIFIDNYFPERLDVAQLDDVLVLDVDAVDFYLE